MNSAFTRIAASFAALAFMGVGLAGCGSSSGSSSSSSSSKSGGKVTLTYMHRLPDSKGMVLVKDIVAKWNKSHPNIQVKSIKFTGQSGDMIKKLETDVKAGNAPDMAQVGYAELPEVYTKGMLEDVTSEAEKYQGNFASGPFKLMSIGGKYYGLPQDTGPLLYFYNDAQFKKLGLTVPKTQNEFISEAKKAASKGKDIAAFEQDEAGNRFSGLAGASKPWYTVKGNAWVVNTKTQGSDEVAKVYQQLLDAKAVDTHPRWDPSFDNALQKSTLIGMVGAAWEAPLIMASAGDSQSGQWRVAQLGDWFGNGSKTGPDGGSGVAILKGCKHPKEAMEFNNWFNTQIDDLTSQGLIVAATTGHAKTPDAWSKYFGGQDVMKEFETANSNMGEFTYMPGFSAVGESMKEVASKAVTGNGKVSNVFNAAQTTSEATLKNYGLSVAK